MKELLALDCSSFETTLASISEIYQARDEHIVSFLNAFNLEKLYENDLSMRLGTGDEELLKAFNKEFGQRKTPMGKIYWFHATRVLKNTDFKEGILPLNKILDRLWINLFAIFNETIYVDRLSKMKQVGVDNRHYRAKSGCHLHYGPYAMLVKETILYPHDMHNHDYLRIPEILEDICNGYKKTYGVEIINDVINSLHPCIVKFWIKDYLRQYYISKAIYYLYNKIHNLPFSHCSGACFDGKGIGINAEQIEVVELIENYIPKTRETPTENCFDIIRNGNTVTISLKK